MIDDGHRRRDVTISVSLRLMLVEFIDDLILDDGLGLVFWNLLLDFRHVDELINRH